MNPTTEKKTEKKKYKTLVVRIPEDAYDAFRKLCEENGTKQTVEVRKFIIRTVKEAEKNKNTN